MDSLMKAHENELKDSDGQPGSTIRPIDKNWIEHMILGLRANPDASLEHIVAKVNAKTGR